MAKCKKSIFLTVLAISRLAWLAFVTITLTPSPITPMIGGLFPENTFRGKVCLLQDLKAGDEKAGEIYKKDFFVRFFIVIQIFYAARFLYRMTRYIDEQCPGGKMCSIGKYRRNILGLKSTFWAGISGSCFLLLQNIVRIVTEHNLAKWQAFYANFIFLDSLIYLFYFLIFSFALLRDIPSVSDTPRKVVFYVSKPTELEPRRPKNQLFTIYQSPNSSHQKIGHQDKNLNVRIQKLTLVREFASADKQLPQTSKHRFIYLTKN